MKWERWKKDEDELRPRSGVVRTMNGSLKTGQVDK